MPHRSYASAPNYRFGFNKQERSVELGIDFYNAEYWEYDTRLGRRWNLDLVEKSWISGYASLGNNPVMMIDPDGADWFRNNKTKEAKWFDGSGKHKGYTYVGTDEQVIFKGKDLDEVTVTAKSKKKKYDKTAAAWAAHMSAFNHTAAEAAQWKVDEMNYDKGNLSALSPSQISMYNRRSQATKEWKQMSYGAVGLMAAPVVAVGLVETGASAAIWNGGRWLFQQSAVESSLFKEGAKWLTRKYGRAFMSEVSLNFFQNGMDIRKMDAFDIFTNTLNPFRNSLRGRVLMGGVNSLVDINLFAGDGQRLSYIGSGKNIGQVGLDFSFSLFNEGVKYTFGTLGGNNAYRDAFFDVLTGNAGGQVQKLAK